MGMLVSTGHDLFISGSNFIQDCRNGNYAKAAEDVIKIGNNALYFSLFLYGGLEIVIASLAIQILLNGYQVLSNIAQAKKEFEENHYREATLSLIAATVQVLLAGVRGRQLWQQAQALHARNELARKELHEKWQFPSDHLPVGTILKIQVGDEVKEVTIISWNVLNKETIHWIEKDSQGLKGSMIDVLNRNPSQLYPENPNLTQREDLVIAYLQKVMADHPNLILALQECHPSFTKALVQSLPPHMKPVVPTIDAKDQNIILYNETLCSDVTVTKAFPFTKPFSKENSTNRLPTANVALDIAFTERDTGKKIQFINCHIPGDITPGAPGCNEFADHVLEQTMKNKDHLVIAAGDMNFGMKKLQLAFAQEAEKRGISSPFKNAAGQDYYTNICPKDTKYPPEDEHTNELDPKLIDHIWINEEVLINEEITSRPMSPKEILPASEAPADLLKNLIK